MSSEFFNFLPFTLAECARSAGDRSTDAEQARHSLLYFYGLSDGNGLPVNFCLTDEEPILIRLFLADRMLVGVSGHNSADLCHSIESNVWSDRVCLKNCQYVSVKGALVEL